MIELGELISAAVAGGGGGESEGSNFDIGTIHGIDVYGEDVDLDELVGEPKGTYTVMLETRLEMLYNVFQMSFGQIKGQFHGSLYAVGTRVLICYVTDNRIPIILGSLPADYKHQYNVGGIMSLKEGECVMQSAPLKFSERNDVSFVGGMVQVRNDGTVVITSDVSGLPARVELGKRYLEESQDDGVRMRISVGGASIMFLNDGTIRTHTYNNIDNTCKVSYLRVATDGFESVEGDKVVYVGKSFILNTKNGAFLTVSEDGNVQVSDKSGKNLIAMDATSGSEALTIVGGDGNYVTLTKKEIDILAQETIKLVSADSISLKSKEIAIDGQSCLISGNKVALGSVGATKGVARKGDCTYHMCPILGVPVAGQISDNPAQSSAGTSTSDKVACS